MNPLAERIRKVIADGHVSSPRAWSELAELSHETVRKFLKGGDKATMRLDSVVALANALPVVNATWLLSGKGEPYASGASEVDVLRAEMRAHMSPRDTLVAWAVERGVSGRFADDFWLERAAREGWDPATAGEQLLAAWRGRDAHPKLLTAADDQGGFDASPKLGSPAKGRRK